MDAPPAALVAPPAAPASNYAGERSQGVAGGSRAALGSADANRARMTGAGAGANGFSAGQNGYIPSRDGQGADSRSAGLPALAPARYGGRAAAGLNGASASARGYGAGLLAGGSVPSGLDGAGASTSGSAAGADRYSTGLAASGAARGARSAGTGGALAGYHDSRTAVNGMGRSSIAAGSPGSHSWPLPIMPFGLQPPELDALRAWAAGPQGLEPRPGPGGGGAPASAREALQFVLSHEGAFFREFLTTEIVVSVDALSRAGALMRRRCSPRIRPWSAPCVWVSGVWQSGTAPPSLGALEVRQSLESFHPS